MTKEEDSVKAVERSSAEKERSSRRTQKKEKVKPPKKIVIRHLPPTMTEEEFLKQIDPLPEHDFYYYAAADWSLGYDATCRAYITLKNEEDVFLFRDRFDSYVFVDSKGAEYPAIVEFAPFQGLLKNKSRRSDNKVNTIEQEPHYQQFLAKLEEDREAAAKGSECKLEFTLDRKKEEKITSTPLLQYLANKKEKRREEAKKRTEEKRRQREEEKEKRRQVQQQQQQVTKIISGQDGGGGGGGGGKSSGSNKSASGKENVAGDKGGTQQEERKNSRSKRREERNQRRREQYEARKQERERERQEKQWQTGEEGGKTEISGEKPEANSSAIGDGKPSTEQPSKHTDEGKQQQGKESKRYNERRDRERNRNRKDKLKEKDDKQKVTGANAGNQGGKTVSSGGGETIVNDAVMSFIRSAAKEFVPKHKQQGREEESEEQQRKADAGEITKESKQGGDSGHINSEDKQTQKQRAADEQRRIRNKDRPSIAIYQPKARLRLSEERDANLQQSGRSNSKGELRSNPTSDCESVKKDESRNGGGAKKVSRYSERRAERRNNREKQLAGNNTADCKDDDKIKQPHARELRKSKSCENESSVSQVEKVVERETAQSGER